MKWWWVVPLVLASLVLWWLFFHLQLMLDGAVSTLIGIGG